MDRGAWWATVHGVAKELDTTYQLNNNNDVLLYLFLQVFICNSTVFSLNHLKPFKTRSQIL